MKLEPGCIERAEPLSFIGCQQTVWVANRKQTWLVYFVCECWIIFSRYCILILLIDVTDNTWNKVKLNSVKLSRQYIWLGCMEWISRVWSSLPYGMESDLYRSSWHFCSLFMWMYYTDKKCVLNLLFLEEIRLWWVGTF